MKLFDKLKTDYTKWTNSELLIEYQHLSNINYLKQVYKTITSLGFISFIIAVIGVIVFIEEDISKAGLFIIICFASIFFHTSMFYLDVKIRITRIHSEITRRGL
jgi:hypothetical protein